MDWERPLTLSAGISLYYAISKDTVDSKFTRSMLMPRRRLVECAHFPHRPGSSLQVRMAGLHRSLDHVRPCHLRHARLRRQDRQVCLQRLGSRHVLVHARLLTAEDRAITASHRRWPPITRSSRPRATRGSRSSRPTTRSPWRTQSRPPAAFACSRSSRGRTSAGDCGS